MTKRKRNTLGAASPLAMWEAQSTRRQLPEYDLEDTAEQQQAVELTALRVIAERADAREDRAEEREKDAAYARDARPRDEGTPYAAYVVLGLAGLFLGGLGYVFWTRRG